MKQRITSEQLNELTPEQQERLREWWKPETFDVIIDEKGLYDAIIVKENGLIASIDVETMKRYDKQNIVPLLSIGQCIELLNSCGWKLRLSQKTHLARIELWRYEGKKRLHWESVSLPELIDALFSAVKEVL